MMDEKLRQPSTETPIGVAVLAEAGAGSKLRTDDGVSEECSGSEHDRKQGIFKLPSARSPFRHAPFVHELGHGPDHANPCARRKVAEPRENEPSHKARVTPVAQGFEDAVEERRRVDVGRVGEAPHQVCLEGGQGPRGDRLHEPFPAAKVVEDGGVGDADVVGDVLKP
jgi:hypothetical protein